ncbi:MAG: hypothetical protein DRI95_10345 [Bacteroidetes bacterium]|nr:MAG: hypothetical protein DRI95_10345 [Bacteroidota bacterium]
MKLLTKTTLYFITVSLFVFFIGGIGIYQLIKKLENDKVNQELIGQMYKLSHDLSRTKSDLQKIAIISSGLISITHVHTVIQPFVQFKDTLMFDKVQNQYVSYRGLTFYADNNKLLYKIDIYKSLTESNYLIEQIAMMVTIMVLFFLLTVYFLYRYFFRQIWSDFFITIDKINRFDISSPEKLDFPESMIIEFHQLNKGLKLMTERIINDFQGLKEFVGNLSHEIQTPLAIIKSKTELLLQKEDLSEHKLQLTGEIHSETLRLSKLIKALTLLTKIDNKQFIHEENINLKDLIIFHIKGFEDIIEIKEIKIRTEILSEPVIKMDTELANILIVNLIKNAIGHNIKKGEIDIELSKESLIIKNSGQALNISPEKLFNRFSKANLKSESLGIGLSIVKKICDSYDIDIKYFYDDGFHELILIF